MTIVVNVFHFNSFFLRKLSVSCGNKTSKRIMKKKFEIEFLPEALDFIYNLDEKTSGKILYNIDKASYSTDPKLFKKLTKDIWEFRTKYDKKQYRLLAFWDRRDKQEILVISSHGFIKKQSKIAKKEIKKAEQAMKGYFK